MFDVERHICYDAYLLVITSSQERSTTRQVTLSQEVRYDLGIVQNGSVKILFVRQSFT